MQIFSAYKKQNYKKDRLIYHLRDTINTGIMLRKRVTQALQFSQKEPLAVTNGIGIDEHNTEGRVITLEFEDFFFVTCYTPNSQNELKRLDYRMKWEDDFREYLLRLNKKKPVILCGDLNVAHNEIDLKNPKTNRKNAGFSDEEREK